MRSYKPNRVLHSGSKNYVVVPYSSTIGYGDHAFDVHGPTLWNTVPHEKDHEKLKKNLIILNYFNFFMSILSRADLYKVPLNCGLLLLLFK